jgi:uncharacterized membrane protein
MEQQSEMEGYLEPGGKNVTLVYVLYLASIVIGITMLIGLIFAYLNRGKAGGWVDTHYTFQIRTFWIGLIVGVVGIILTFVFIGVFLLIALLIWMIVRCIKGLQLAARGEPVPDPQTLLF